MKKLSKMVMGGMIVIITISLITVIIPSFVIAQNGTIKWVYELESDAERAEKSPAVDTDGTIYIFSNGNNLYAVNSDGSNKWIFKTDSFSYSTAPLIGDNGAIYIATLGDKYTLYAVDRDGNGKWKFIVNWKQYYEPGIALGTDGTIYFATSYDLYAINPNGSLKWIYESESAKINSVSVTGDGTIYISGYGISAINPDGSLKWRSDPGVFFQNGLAIDSNGIIYGIGIGYYTRNHDELLYAINPDGSLRWFCNTSDEFRFRIEYVVIGADGTIYANAYGSLLNKHRLILVNPDGSRRSTINIDNSICSPVIGTNGSIYYSSPCGVIGAVSSGIFAFNLNGSEKWFIELSDHCYGSPGVPAIGSDGTIYLSGIAGKLYAINTTSTSLIRANTSEGSTDSPWPMYQRNAKHTGRSEVIPASSELQLLSPVVGEMGTVSSDSQCRTLYSSGRWCFNQHRTGFHHPGGGVCGSDDTFAWDANLNYPSYDQDASKPVYAVAAGKVTTTYGGCVNAGGTCGQVLVEHDIDGEKWWSGYVHLKDINVETGEYVTTETKLGVIGKTGTDNNHLHFVIYRGQNESCGLNSYDATIHERKTLDYKLAQFGSFEEGSPITQPITVDTYTKLTPNGNISIKIWTFIKGLFFGHDSTRQTSPHSREMVSATGIFSFTSPVSSITAYLADFNGNTTLTAYDGKDNIIKTRNIQISEPSEYTINDVGKIKKIVISSASCWLGYMIYQKPIVIDHDFNVDGKPDALYRHPGTGNIGVWLLDGTTETSWQLIGNHGTTWDIRGTGDFNSDGKPDVVYRHSNGNIGVWLMDGTEESAWHYIGNHGTAWDIRAVGDMNGDGRSDLLYRHANGKVGVWLMDGTAETTWQYIGNHGDAWDIRGVGDFNGDGHTDILYRHSGDSLGVWLMSGATETTWSYIGNHGTAWDAKGIGDFNSDGRVDILYRHTNGNVGVWLMNGTAETSWRYVGNHGSWDIR